MIEEIQNKTQLEELKKKYKNFLMVAFYSETSEKSLRTIEILKKAKKDNPDMPVYAVNATRVKDIHPLFGVNTVPTVLALKDGKVSKVVNGIQSQQYYEMLLYDMPFTPGKGKEGPRRHNVVVYTSPHCPWCTRVKSHLKENRIPFREVDVTRDERTATELVRRSGQMGTPQTDIDGRIIVGFNQQKIDALLGINNSGQ